MKRFLAILLTATLLMSMAPAVSMAAQYAVVVGGWLRLRDGASFDHNTITSYYTGTQVEILSQAGDWYRVRTPDGRKGYMYSDYLKMISGSSLPSGTGAAWVTSRNGYGVRLRTGPGTGYRIIDVYDVGTPVTILQRGNTWCKIRIGDVVGYMMSQFLTTGSSGSSSSNVIGYATIWSRNGYGVRLRTGPGTGYGKIGVYSVGTTVAILEKGAVWDRIRVGSREGWMMNEFLRYHNVNEITSVSITPSNPVVGDVMHVQAVTPSNAKMNYQWLVDSQIKGTGATYTVTAQDVGKSIQLRVTGIGSYCGTVFSAVTSKVVSQQQITGVQLSSTLPVVGDTLSVTITPANASVTYAWKVGSAQVSTASTYTVTASDVGKIVEVTVTGTSGFTGVASAATAQVIAAAQVTAVSLRNETNTQSGAAPSVGDKLTAVVSPTQSTVNYQWLRGSNVISGATGASYTLTDADEGARISVKVTGYGAYAGTQTSAQTAVVLPKPAKPVIDDITLPGVMVGNAYNTRLTAQGGSVTWQLASGSMPDGLSLNADGTITGTPEKSGQFSFTVTASNAAGTSDPKSFSLTVAPIPTPVLQVGNVALPAVTEGYTQTVSNVIPITNNGNAAATLANVYTDNSACFVVNVSGGSTSVPAGSSDSSYTVQAVPGLKQGTYSGNLYVVYDQNVVASSTVQLVVEAPAPQPVAKPVLAISVPAIPAALEGYQASAGVEITLANSGNADANIVDVASSSSSFLTVAGSSKIPAGVTDKSWTVKPAQGLPVGTHSATITVLYDNGASAMANVSFAVKSTYSVTVNGGTGSGTYAEGATVSIAANVGANEQFNGWKSDDGVAFADQAAAVTTFTMPAKSVTVTADVSEIQQTPTRYLVNVVNGTLDNGQTSGEYAAGATVAVTASVGSDQVFNNWTADVNDVQFADAAAAATTFTMPAGTVTVTANTSTAATPETSYTVTVNGGTGSGQYSEGAAVTITATIGQNQQFDGWTVADNAVQLTETGVGMANFQMPAKNVTITANVSDVQNNRYYVTVQGGNDGEYEAGELVTITANVPSGQQFAGWTTSDAELADPSAATTTFIMPAKNVTITANFTGTAPTLYYVTVQGGADGEYAEGAEVTITANVPEGKKFDNWTTGDVELADSTAATTTFIMPAKNVTITANFSDIPVQRYAVTVNGGSGGSEYAEGELVTITASVPEGKQFDSWSTSDVTLADSTAATTTFVMPGSAVTVTSNFSDIPVQRYYVTVNGGPDGEYEEGSMATITANVPEGKLFNGWTTSDVTLDDPSAQTTTFVMPGQDVTVTANFIDAPAPESEEGAGEIVE